MGFRISVDTGGTFTDIVVMDDAGQQTIGKVTPEGKGEVFVELPGKSTGNGIVFDEKRSNVNYSRR